MKLYTLRYTNGTYHTIQRMPIKGRMVFSYHLKEAYQILSKYPESDISSLYCENDKFSYHCDECLKINNINPELISDTQFITFLFGSKEYPYGLINSINFNLSQSLDNARPAKAETYGSIIGKLWRSLGDLSLALKLAETLPVDVLEEAMYELKPAEDKYIDKARELMNKIRGGQK
jgi:hypothetical protein